MDVGALRHRLIIQTPTQSQSDTTGFETDSWGAFATVWGSVKPMQGRERWQAMQVQPDVTHEITIRHLKGVNPEKRILAPKETTNLSAAISTTDGTTVTVNADFGISKSTQFRIYVDSEIMLVTSGHGTTTWNVTRGVDGTTAATHADDALVTLMGVFEIESVQNWDERNVYQKLQCKENL